MIAATEKILEEIESLAELQFSPREVAIIVGIDPEDYETEVALAVEPHALAYIKGQLKAEAEVRKSIFQLAKQGSSPAQKQMMEIITRNKAALNQNKLELE